MSSPPSLSIRALALAAALIALAAVAVPAIRPSSGAAATTQAGNPCLDFHAGENLVTVDADGLARTAVVRIPPGLARTARVPLVLAFHGSGKSGRQFEAETGLGRLADRARFIAVFPNAAPPSHVWQVNERGTYDLPDVKFVGELVDLVRERACIDPDRMYAVGVSNGGGMTARIACQLADRFAAVAIVAGGYSTLPACAPARPLSVLEIHGTADAAAPYLGRPFGPGGALVGSVPSFVRLWARLDGCKSERMRPLGTGQDLLSWNGCAAGTQVQHVRIAGGAHGWPGGNPFTTTRRAAGLVATDAVWSFLRSQRRSSGPAPTTNGGSSP